MMMNSQKSFQTSPESSESDSRACQSFFKLNYNIYKKKLWLAAKYFANAIVEFEE